MEYFYAPRENISQESIKIEGEEFKHLVHVMRRKEGDTIRVVNGEGTAYDVTIINVRKKMAVGRIDGIMEGWNESSIDVTMGVGILKNPSKFDFLVEKVTELGVKNIIPMTTERTIPHHTKVERWRKLALAAMKQSGRSYLPRVDNLVALPDVLKTVRPYDLSMVCHESAAVTRTISEVFPRASVRKDKSVLTLIGPEGGLSEEEYAECLAAGCIGVTLGPRRLRTETAAVAAAALILQQ